MLVKYGTLKAVVCILASQPIRKEALVDADACNQTLTFSLDLGRLALSTYACAATRPEDVKGQLVLWVFYLDPCLGREP